jgi:hypothetical protein
MELSINRAVDCSGLEAGVGVAKRYRGCHRSRAVCDEVLPVAECLDIRDIPVKRRSLRTDPKTPVILLKGLKTLSLQIIFLLLTT